MDLNLSEMWCDLKRAVDARKPSNMAELKQFCKEEWASSVVQLLEMSCVCVCACACVCGGALQESGPGASVFLIQP